MKSARLKALAALTAAAIAVPGTAMAQQSYSSGTTVPSYTTYGTTGVPSGSFTMPSVQLRRNTTSNAQTQQGRIFNPSTQPQTGTQQTATGNSATNPPASPENPNALQTGRSISAQDRAKEQGPSAGETGTVKATTSAQQQRYTAGMVISGKAKVYDGHSLLVDGNAVRLDGADAPGLLQTCQSNGGASWRCGETSYRRLKELADGKNVSCRVVAQVGDGAAAICTAQGTGDLAQFLVREGLAVPNGHDKGRYAQSADAARNAKAGMWVGSFEAPWKWRTGRGG